MLDNLQFRECIVRVALMPLPSPARYTLSAEQLLVATMAHESLGGKYVLQKTNDKDAYYGGGHGIYQIEKPTYAECIKLINRNPELRESILDSCGFNDVPSIDEVIWNLRYATIIARVNYLRFPETLPVATDLNAIWGYYKKYWNTSAGSADKESFMRNYYNFTASSKKAQTSPSEEV